MKYLIAALIFAVPVVAVAVLCVLTGAGDMLSALMGLTTGLVSVFVGVNYVTRQIP